ncbi:MAG: flagellar basal body L-ring protein FlgH [Rhizobiaceae bacterium]
MIRSALLVVCLSLLGGCAANTFKEINKPPELSPIDVGYAAGGAAGSAAQDGVYYKDGNYPAAPPPSQQRFSLWHDRQSRLFTDPRALQQGDILTVRISINDRAKFKNESDRSRTASRSLGLKGSASSAGGSVDGAADGKIQSGTESSGAGATTRSEAIELLVAAIVTGVLPNGNLLIQGSQEVRVNAELRILTIEGIVRPSDIEADNMISYERIAEARISYGGRGRITEVQQPPYGQQVLDIVLPF